MVLLKRVEYDNSKILTKHINKTLINNIQTEGNENLSINFLSIVR